MAVTSIDWTDYSFNPWIGCEPVSPGCLHCYAERINHQRKFTDGWGKGAPRSLTSSTWKTMRTIQRRAAKGEFVYCLSCNKRQFRKKNCVKDEHMMVRVRPRVFACSMGDWLDPEVPAEWLLDFMELITDCPSINWQLLTKRPELFHIRMEKVLEATRDDHERAMKIIRGWDPIPGNVWFGISAEDQIRYDQRARHLKMSGAQIRFLSCEPLLSSIEFDPTVTEWVITGGESEKKDKARPAHMEWIQAITDQCRESMTPCFVKQLGTNPFYKNERLELPAGKNNNPLAWPAHFEFPRDFPL